MENQPSWAILGLCWPHLGPSWGPCWAIWGLCWPMLGLCWPMLGLCWPILGLCWPNLDAFLGRCWAMLAHLEPQERKNGKSKKHCNTRDYALVGSWSAAGVGAPLSYGEERMPYKAAASAGDRPVLSDSNQMGHSQTCPKAVNMVCFRCAHTQNHKMDKFILDCKRMRMHWIRLWPAAGRAKRRFLNRQETSSK